ncbi:MAG TPA: cupin domain-containing protein [Chloroflexota bacterium]|nr:cupin domain-containing protein [Chloroflexota bacterium]
MFHVLRRADLPASPSRTVRFEGEPYGAGVSFFLVDDEPGQGAELHRHPYPETWIVRAGRARITAAAEEVEAGPGDVVVVEAGTPHGFHNLGPGRLELVCIHAADRMATDWLEAPR